MEIVQLLYVLCVIPIAGIISAVIMLIKDVHKYRKSFLKRLMITALIALLLLGGGVAAAPERSTRRILHCRPASEHSWPGIRIPVGLVGNHNLACMVELVRDMQFFHGRRETFVRQE